MFRELTKKNRQLPMEACIELLMRQPRGVLSVLGDDDYPYGLPMDHWYCKEDGCIYFHSGNSGHKIDAIKKHAKASFCVYDQGFREEGDWALHIKSVIVFGRIQIVEDPRQAIALTRQLSYKYTSDSAYIEDEIRKYASSLLVFRLIPEHICGKQVKES